MIILSGLFLVQVSCVVYREKVMYIFLCSSVTFNELFYLVCLDSVLLSVRLMGR